MDTTIPIQEILGYVTAAIFTLLILSYALKDNPLYKIAVNIFIGAVAGYTGAIALRDVIIGRISNMSPQEAIIPIILIILLLLKIAPKTAKYGNISSALLLGVGAAIAVLGAIQGTLIPIISSSSKIFSPLDIQLAAQNEQGAKVFMLILQGSIVLAGIVSTLTYFHFTARKTATQAAVRPKLIDTLAKIGQGFIAITFGVIFAGVYSAALTALVERINFLIETVKIFQGMVN